MKENKSFYTTICFADGRLSALREGSRIMEKYGVFGSFYPITDRVGTTNEHGEYAPWEDVEKMNTTGHEVGSLSHHHRRDLHEIPPEKQREDIGESLRLFRLHCINVETFVYPFGNHSKELVRVVRERRFLAGVTFGNGVNFPGDDSCLLQSHLIQRGEGVSDIEGIIKEAEQKNGWLILAFHHLDDKTWISTPPEIFEEMLVFLLNKGTRIVTLREGARIMQG